MLLHKTRYRDGFTNRYNATKLVYYERFADIADAILREKSLKKGTRQRKVNLVNRMNPTWEDLYPRI